MPTWKKHLLNEPAKGADKPNLNVSVNQVTDAKPQEFAEVIFNKFSDENDIWIGGHVWQGSNHDWAERINEAFSAHVRRAVEEFRERAAKVVETETIPFTGDEPMYWREHASFLASKARAIRALPLEAEGK